MAFPSNTKAPVATNKLRQPQGTAVSSSTSATRPFSTSTSNNSANSTNTKKRGHDGDDNSKGQPAQKKPLIGDSLWGAKTGGIQPRAPKTYTQRMVNGKLMSIDAVEKLKREAAEKEARSAKALEKFDKYKQDQADNYNKSSIHRQASSEKPAESPTSNAKPSASTATGPRRAENTKRTELSSTIEVSGIKNAVEEAKEEPPKRIRRLMKGRRPESKTEDSTSTPSPATYKAEKRKRSGSSSDVEGTIEVQPAKPAKRQMNCSERRDPERKLKTRKDEVVKRNKKGAQSIRKATEKEEEPKKGEKKEQEKEEKKQAMASEEGNDEPPFDTPKEVVAWFAKNYPQASEVCEETIKLYIKPSPETPTQRARRIEEEEANKEKERMQQLRQDKLDNTFAKEAQNEAKLHVKPTNKRNAKSREEYQLMKDGVVPETRNISPATTASFTPARSTSDVASDQTARTSAEPSPKGPSSPIPSASICESGVSPLSAYPPPPKHTHLLVQVATTTGHVKFQHKMTDGKQIKQRVADINDQVRNTKKEATEHEDTVTSLKPRRGWGRAETSLKEDLDQRTNELEEKLKDAQKKQKCFHRNIDKVTFGPLEIPAWYSSDYQNSCVGGANVEKSLPKKPVVDNLYVCQNCFAYTTNIEEHAGHSFFCPNEVPGEKVYDHAGAGVWSVWQVDGETDKVSYKSPFSRIHQDWYTNMDQLFCQNISLFAKLFLADKTVSYHTKDFYYFLLVHTDAETGHKQIVGFFSKEKNSYDGNNLACILVFPPWQGMGLGKMLMGISYEISRMEEIIGGPERPFSALGEKSYKRYWQAELARWILTHPTTDKKKGCLMVDIQRISRETCILERDCIDTINSMELGLLPKYPSNAPDGGQPIILDKEKVRQWVQENKVNLDRVVDAGGFVKEFSKRMATLEDEEEDD